MTQGSHQSPNSDVPRDPQYSGGDYSQVSCWGTRRGQEGALLNHVCWLPLALTQANYHPALHGINGRITDQCRLPVGCSEGTTWLHLKARVPKPQVARSVLK